MKKIIVLIMIFISTNLYASDYKWDKLDTALEITTELLLIVDWNQTNNINRDEGKKEIVSSTTSTCTWDETGHSICQAPVVTKKKVYKYYETNQFLGTYPSSGKVDKYFIAHLIVHPLVSYMLPKKTELWGLEIHPREMWQMLYISVESNAVYNNYRIGIRTNF